jgi:hypothetical protein
MRAVMILVMGGTGQAGRHRQLPGLTSMIALVCGW